MTGLGRGGLDRGGAGRLVGAAAAGALLALGGVGVGLIAAGGGPVTDGGLADAAALGAPEPPQAVPAQPVQWTESTVSGRYYSPDERNNIAIYDALSESVVNVAAVGSALYRFRPVPRSDSGSGVIIDGDGYVLTSHHVIKNASRLSVTLWDGSEHDAQVVGKDPENDLAVIRFEPGDMLLTVVPFGDSTDLRVGQKVLAIGSPFGQDRSLTTGIVSGLGRPVQADDGVIIQEMIQTDAAINPGNSGGPLLDANGRMIGINTMIFSPTGVSTGVGFAVPIATARRVLPDLIEHGAVRRGWIDADMIRLNDRLARRLGVPRRAGMLVSSVRAGTNAARAGLRGGTRQVRWGQSVFYVGGDVIVEVDGRPIGLSGDLRAALEDNKPGQRVQVTVERGGRLLELSVVLSERPQ